MHLDIEHRTDRSGILRTPWSTQSAHPYEELLLQSTQGDPLEYASEQLPESTEHRMNSVLLRKQVELVVQGSRKVTVTVSAEPAVETAEFDLV